MRRTGYVYDDRYLRHDPGAWHPERPDRLKAIQKNLKATGLLELVVPIPPYAAPLKWVERLHDPRLHPAVPGGLRQGEEHL